MNFSSLGGSAARMKLGGSAARMKRTAVLAVLIAIVLAGKNQRAGAQDSFSATGDETGSVVSVGVRPTQLDLGSGAMPIEIWVEGAPPTTGFELTMSFDPQLIAVTAAEAGSLLADAGGAVVFKPRFGDGGNLSLSGSVVLDEGLPAPSGDGVLATVTLAPLASGPSQLDLSNVKLKLAEPGEDGDELVVEETVDGSVVVSLEPPESVVDEAAAQATQMADSLGGAGAYVPQLPDLSRYGSIIVWLGLLTVALAVVVIGWLVGRKPRGGGDDSDLYSGGSGFGG